MSYFNTLLKQITIFEPYQLTAPSIYCNSNKVSIETKVQNATILYTTDGTEPVLSTATVYTQPFEIFQTVTVKAIVIRPGYKKSNATTQVCQYQVDYNTLPMFLQNETSSSGTVYVRSTQPTPTVYYSTDDMQTWNSQMVSSGNSLSITIPANGRIYFKATESNGHLAWDSSKYTYISSSVNVSVGGNIQSMLYGTSFNGQTEFQSVQNATWAFSRLFLNCTNLVSAENLKLSATALPSYCYGSMFEGCTNLASVPTLPATTLASSCYAFMFKDCTSLTTAPSLPVTTLETYCYEGMFQGCTSLTTAPVLPATVLPTGSYSYMFSGCTSLNYIKAMFVTEPGNSYTFEWVKNVAASGTFVKSATASWTTTGVNGVPTGWTVQTELGGIVYQKVSSYTDISDGDVILIGFLYDTSSRGSYNIGDATTIPTGSTGGSMSVNTLSSVSVSGTEYLGYSSGTALWEIRVSSVNGHYTLANSNGDLISKRTSGTNLTLNETGSGYEEWTFEANTSGSSAMVPDLTGILIKNYAYPSPYRVIGYSTNNVVSGYALSNNDNASYNLSAAIFKKVSL